MRNPCDVDAQRHKNFHKVARRGLPLHISTQRENDLVRPLNRNPREERGNTEVLRPHMVERRELSAKRMIKPAKCSCPLKRKDVGGIFYNTDLAALTLWSQTDFAKFFG